MYREHERSRTRPRVSKACERCKIKKAKCDGLKPCKRCNLDKAPCTYKIRRKTESANVTQRYTNLLLQHHAALTAGLIELYSRSLKGQRWTGPHVEEINGTPSVHRILEELGVIETEDDAISESISETPARRVPVSPDELKPATIGFPPKIKKQQRTAPSKRAEPQGLQSPGYSTISAISTSTRLPQASSLAGAGQHQQPSSPGYNTQLYSPSPSGALSRRSSGCHSTSTPWESPEFTEELFTTPVPSSTCSPVMRPQECHLLPQTKDRYHQAPAVQAGNEAQTSDFSQQDIYNPEGTFPGLAMPFGSSAETDGYNTGYFYDATSCGTGVSMGMYPWDGNAGNFVGYPGFGQDYSAWDSGVFV